MQKRLFLYIIFSAKKTIYFVPVCVGLIYWFGDQIIFVPPSETQVRGVLSPPAKPPWPRVHGVPARKIFGAATYARGACGWRLAGDQVIRENPSAARGFAGAWLGKRKGPFLKFTKAGF